MLARAGEYTVVELQRGLASFLGRYRPAALAKAVSLGMPMRWFSPGGPCAVPRA